ncbi:MAG: ferritin-like domain-containing protein [Chloroflexota bacterium]|nr:ferritin-like domain-containing protein [Chloroflexota bacterium]
MGTEGRKIVGLDIGELLEILNKAFADEWLAYYQYWIGAKVIKGPMKGAVAEELIEHAEEELGHADMLAERILELGGTPLNDPTEWKKHTTCGYEEPVNDFVEDILAQNIKGEQCAIDVYQELCELTRELDPVTYNMALSILEDEVDHEEELQSLEEDLHFMMMRR